MSIQFRARTVNSTISAYPPVMSGITFTSGTCCYYGFIPIGGPERGEGIATSLAPFTKPECDAVNGLFINSSSSCPTTCANDPPSLISQDSGSCCYSVKINNVYTPTCVDNVTELECSLLNQGNSEGLPYRHAPMQQSILDGNLLAFENLYNTLGNCCTQNESNQIVCSILPQNKCAGYWYSINEIRSCSGLTACSGIYFSGNTGGTLTPETKVNATASLAVLQQSPNIIEVLPPFVGDSYQGGLYVGIYQQGEIIRGNINSGTARDYTARKTGIGTNKNKWILIAAPFNYYSLAMNSNTSNPVKINTSIYDGAYNTYGPDSNKSDVYDDVFRVKINGFNDWYVPSQDELALYFKNIPYGFEPQNFKRLTEDFYMSSTIYSNKNHFLGYSQNAAASNYGNVSLLSVKRQQNIRLFRRIYLNS